MVKLLKIIGRFVGITLEWIFIIVILFSFLIRTSPVQTFIAQEATDYLSEKLDVDVSIDKIAVIFPNEIALHGVYMEDEKKDTLLSCQSLYIEVGKYDVKTITFNLKKVELERGFTRLQFDENGRSNFSFIGEKFGKDTTKKSEVKFDVIADEIILKETTFIYDDDRVLPTDFGVDYSHIRGDHINAIIEDVEVSKYSYKAFIRKFSVIEKSGFNLYSLKTHAKVSSEGILLTELSIKSPGTIIYAPRFNMVSNEFSDFKDFVDKVKFDAQLNKSTIALSEIAYFAPALEGMIDTIQLSCIVSKKIPELRLSSFNLKFKDKTQIKATLNLPDFRNMEGEFLQEKIKYAYIDLEELQSLKMPKSFDREYISLDENTNRLAYFVAEDFRLDGFVSQFVLSADRISTHLGSVRINNGLMFTKNSVDGSFDFQQSTASDYDLKIEQFNLGQFLGNNQLGIVDGFLFVSGKAFSSTNLEFYSIEGEINRFDFMEYPYKNISILDSRMMDNSFEGTIDVDDENLCMHYNGIVDFKRKLHFDFELDIDEAKLDKLNLSITPETKTLLSSDVKVDMEGSGPNNFEGSLSISNLFLNEIKDKENKKLSIPSLDFSIVRGEFEDVFSLKSNVADVELKGQIDFDKLSDDFQHQMDKILPSLTQIEEKNHIAHDTENFTFQLNVKNAVDILNIFLPELQIAPETKLIVDYQEKLHDYSVTFNSAWVNYNDFVFKAIDFNQEMGEDSLQGYLKINELRINDSTSFNNVVFQDRAINDEINSVLEWGKDSSQLSTLVWDTKLYSWDAMDVSIHPSYFSLKEYEWHLEKESDIVFRRDTISIDHFELTRGEQSIFLEGRMSKSQEDKLNFDIKNVNLEEVSNLLQIANLSGKTNATGTITTPFEDFQFFGEASILDLFVLGEEVGNVDLVSKWLKEKQSIELKGDLEYRNTETFQFIGDYYTKREKDKLDFFLNFNNTDIHFTNAFMNPQVVSKIKGHLEGKIKVTGSPDHPILNGEINLKKGGAKVEMLGTSFTLDGPILVDEQGFYINSVPLFDEEGNAGSVVGAVFHDNFRNFNFDLQIDVEDDAVNKDPLKPWVPLKLESFLVLNTKSSQDAAYYGKAYATGTVNLFGYTDNLEIKVNLKTRKGTTVSIPMYGVSEIEEESFIVFVNEDNSDTTQVEDNSKIDFTGVDLDLNFEVTPDATIKIVFDENIEDEIIAKGTGDVNINLNSLGDITMDGLFTVLNGVYDFSLGPVKKKFYIDEGGTISWSGDPYNAMLDLKTYYRVNANIATLTNNQLGQGSGARQPVLCYLNLSESLIKPKIDFDIQAPNADEISQSLITRIKSDPDELNRQFFSLLLWRRFQPLTGSSSSDGSAALELVANQINSILSKMSNEYILNVDLSKDQLTGDNSYEFGLKKGFLDDKLILSGSFGIENQKVDKDANKNYLIGDVRLEYVINEQGTFRVNVFNESNDRTVINSQKQGAFTQGVGLSYKESFNTIDDFKVIQKFLNLFRREEDKRFKRKRKLTPIPKQEENENR